MTAWRMPLTVLLLLSAGPAALAQTHQITEGAETGDCFQYKLDMSLSGEMRFIGDDGKPLVVKLTAAGSHAYAERSLAVEGGLVVKSARAYKIAKASIQRGNDKNENTLRAERSLIVAQRHKDAHLVYSPAGALTRGELEVVSEHFDTLAVAGILPAKAVAVGDTWELSNPVAQALTGMEGMTKHDLKGKLEKVEGETATVSVKGTAAGVWQGASVKTSVEAKGTYDLGAKRFTTLEWKQKDDRDQGPVSPASSMQVSVTVTRAAAERPAALDDVALVSVPDGFVPLPQMTNLEYREQKGRYALVHPRDWFLTAESAEHVVLRLMDKGVWVAQVTVTPWKKAKKGEHLTAEQFEQAMHDTSGWRPERKLQAGEVPSEGGKWTYRLSETGQLNGVNVLQNFYLVANDQGDQVVLAFTLAPKMADKLGAHDLTLAASIEVPAKK